MRHTPTCVKHAMIWPMQIRELRRKNTEQTELSLEYLERTIAEKFKLIQHGRVPIVYRSMLLWLVLNSFITAPHCFSIKVDCCIVTRLADSSDEPHRPLPQETTLELSRFLPSSAMTILGNLIWLMRLDWALDSTKARPIAVVLRPSR
jgi:hypothetical protein